MTNQTSRAKTDAHHKEVAEAIIKMIEGGTAPWQKPWDGNASAMMLMPFNGASKRRYRGINSLYLYTVANFKGYKDPRWFTFKQVEELGGKVKRGEKSVKVEYWQFKRTIKEDENGKPLAKEDWLEVDRKVPLIMRSAVFNAEQCEGIPELELPKRDWEPLERADTIMKASGVPVFHDAVDRNYYSPGSDEIHLTPMEAFPTREAYYGTALHELGHSTGHEKRLNRQFGKTFGDENYAKEELRAEIASFMLCSDLGISRQASDEQHAAYVGSWVKALKSDPNEIFKASADAENICNYLYDREREYMKNLGNEIEPNVPNNSVNYPEVEPSVTKVAEQVAGYGVPEFNRPEEMNKSNLSEIDTFFSTNYVSRADGSRMNVYVVDGKTYLGKSQNVMFEDGVDEAGRSVTHRYYDNADGSLIYLSDKAKMATFIADRSYGLPQDRMSNIGSYDFDDVLEAQHHEISRLFLDYSFVKDRLPELNDNLIKINSAAISNFEFGGKQLNVFVKDDAVYVGLRERYFTRGVYDNSDYTLMKVSDNRKMFHLLQGTGYVDSQEKMLAQELFSERDFIEYAELKAGALKKFEQVRELTFDGVPFKSPLAENEPVKGAAEMDKGKVDYGLEADFNGQSIGNELTVDKDMYLKFDEAWVTNYYTSEDNKRLGTFVIDGKAYLGSYVSDAVVDSKFLGTEREGTTDYYDSYYINDGSLVKLSDNPKIAELVSARSFQVFEGGNLNLDGFSVDDLLEARTIESNLLNKYQLLKDVPSGVNENLLIVSKAVSTKILNKDYVPMYAYEVNGSVYLGNQRSYEYGKTYASIDSFIKVSDNPNVLPFLHSRDLEELSKFGNFSESDFNEYAVLKGDKLSEFLSHYQNFDSEVVENSVKEVNSGMERKGYNIDNSYTTNFVEDGKQLGAFVIDGKAYLGLRANMKYQPEKDENGFDVMISYYDNSDGSLVHLSDKPEMASFIAERSFDIYQDSMADLGKFTLEDAREAERLESTVLSGYDEWSELPPRGMDDSLIVIDGAKPSNYVRDGKEQIAFVKNYEVYLGDASRYNGERVYDNSDYSLVKVSSNVQMYHVINGLSEGATREELISSGAFSVNDFVEYDEMRERILNQFEEVVPDLAEAEIAINAQPLSVDVPESELNAAIVDEAARELEDNPYEGMTEVVEFVHTNFLKDGRRINMVNLNGEVHLGYDDNCKYNIIMGDAPQTNRAVSYYDNRDGSLEYLGLHPNMAHFVAGMSYGWTQDEMLMVINSKGLEPAFTSPQYENWEFLKAVDFSDLKYLAPVEQKEDDRQIALHSAGSIKYVDSDGQALAMFEKQGSYYIGKESNFNEETGRYDNNDYSLFKVTDRVNVKNLIVNEGLDAKDALEKGSLTVADIDEYGLFRERTNQLFHSTGSNVVHNQRMMLASSDYEVKYPVLSGATIVPSNIKDLVLISSVDNALSADNGTYLGKRQNLLFIYRSNHFGDKVYDNRDGSLVKLSDNPRMADLISERSLGYGKDVIMETYEGEFSDKDFEEYNKIFDEHLSKLEFTSTYEDMGRFDIKEAMKMADEQVNGQVNEAAKEFNPPSDAQLALAESLHCKYKEDVSREDLAKIIAKTMEARKKYYEAINQPAKETQLDVLKEAGIEVKDGLTIGQASKMIAELPASTNQKVFMDRLKIEYAPEITRGEVEKLIKGKMKELEARENEPASEKTREFMKSRGIEVPEKLTRAEASKLIYNSAPTAKQMAFITNHKIECDKEKLTYGKASILIDKRLKYIDEQAKLPATEKQIKRLEKEKIEFAPEITRGEANKLINKAVMEKLQVSEKQIKYANDLGLEIPENATKAEVTKLIGEKVKANRIDKIADFEVPKDRKLTLSEGYYKLAQKYLEKGKEIDDKKIAASLLKDGHRDCDVKSVIHKNSPNCVNDLSKAQGYVNEAKKLPSVKKALEKENSR